MDSVSHVLGYVWKKIKRLLIPFYVWNFVYLLLQTIMAKMPELWRGVGYGIGNQLSLYNLLVWPWTHDQPIGFNVASWFLIALFLVEIYNIIIEWMFSKIKLRNETVLLILSLVISLIGIRFIQNGSTGFLKILSRSMYCLFFFRLGHWYKACGEKRDTLNSTMYFLILFALQFLFKIKYDNLTSGVYGGVDFEYLPVILLVPIVGIMFWLRVAKLLTPLLKEVKWLVFLGKNTMPVMIHHLFAIFLMQTVIYMIHCNTTIFSTFDVNRYMSSMKEMKMRKWWLLPVLMLIWCCSILPGTTLYMQQNLTKD